MKLRRIAVSAAVAALAVGVLAACGEQEEVHHGATEGVYVSTGGLKYQVQISRILNPTDFEDQDYLRGLAATDRVLAPSDTWFAVFIRVFNRGEKPVQSANRFTILDTTGKRFTPIQVDRRANSTVYIPRVLKGGDQLPLPGSLARENLTQGGLVLFRLPISSLANRPLELHIASPVGGQDATVDLDV
jgi:hypothetical protein